MEQQLIKDMEKWELGRPYLMCCVTDTASNKMFGEKIQGWNDVKYLRHHYCANHVLQLTAVKAYSGNNTLNADSEDHSVSVIRKVRYLVSHVNSSYVVAEKLTKAQRTINAAAFIYKLMSDCKTRRWWSTLLMIERAFDLKGPLKLLFEDEFRLSANTQTTLESLALSDDDFDSLKSLIYVLTPFKRSQKALEGETYVHISLLPYVVKEIHNQLERTQGAIDPDQQQDLYNFISNMI
jgi:hypothetical protein